MHRDVVGDGLTGSIGDDEDANLRGQVGVRLVQVEVNILALNAHDAANLELLADDGSEGVQAILDGALAHGGGEQCVQVGSLGGDGGGQDLVGEVDELLVLGDEVGLRVDLDQHADGAVGLSGQQAGGGLAALALGQGLQALQADDLEGLLGVAVGLGQSLLDIHHAGAGLLTQRLHICSGEIRHRMIPLS